MLYDNVDMVCSQGMYNNKRSNVAGLDLYYGPENKMPLPCETCSMMNECGETGKECSAFRAWTTTGEYDVNKVMKLVK